MCLCCDILFWISFLDERAQTDLPKTRICKQYAKAGLRLARPSQQDRGARIQFNREYFGVFCTRSARIGTMSCLTQTDPLEEVKIFCYPRGLQLTFLREWNSFVVNPRESQTTYHSGPVWLFPEHSGSPLALSHAHQLTKNHCSARSVRVV